MDTAPRSGCPINAAVEVLGDPWAMLVLRDIMFGNRRHFRELIAGSEEGIATNILASRLKQRVRVREITNDEGQRLLRIVRRSSGSVVRWRRAQIVLLSAQGMDVPRSPRSRSPPRTGSGR